MDAVTGLKDLAVWAGCSVVSRDHRVENRLLWEAIKADPAGMARVVWRGVTAPIV